MKNHNILSGKSLGLKHNEFGSFFGDRYINDRKHSENGAAFLNRYYINDKWHNEFVGVIGNNYRINDQLHNEGESIVGIGYANDQLHRESEIAYRDDYYLFDVKYSKDKFNRIVSI